MRSRRFALLAAFLVALNVCLWLVPQGLALQRAIVNQLFGPKMIRAEVVVRTPTGPQDYRLDRGVISTVSATSLVLAEQDGTTQTIALDPATKVTGPRRFSTVSALRHGLRVLVTRQANGAASRIEVEGVGGVRAARVRGSGNGN